MKKIYIYTILTVLLFSNCEKVVDIDVPTIEPKLIIDASFEVLFNESPVKANVVVKLKLSTDYFDDTIPTVSDAIVFLTNTVDNAVINFSDVNLNGNFTPIINFIPKDAIAYELTVIYKNEIYKGNATKVKSTKINSAIQGDETLFSGKEIEVKVAFKDNVDNENYYLFNFTNNLFLPLEDRFFNGTNYNFSFFYQEEEIEVPKNVTVTMSGITKDYFTYFRILQNQSGTSGGGPFQSVPSSLLGNVINTSNEANFPLGYFHISETDTINLDLVEKN
ncbi:DUF4249 domain-containing protein [Polaribacter sp.]|nr:DUF4249 domain-containing protein [Polaribacter sp.]MDB4205057.1 DUF4249 domain-containing protein [Polaribacter sp.]MDC1237800.1 DUF4249 domain-containing protein [Polaribacter sp.]